MAAITFSTTDGHGFSGRKKAQKSQKVGTPRCGVTVRVQRAEQISQAPPTGSAPERRGDGAARRPYQLQFSASNGCGQDDNGVEIFGGPAKDGDMDDVNHPLCWHRCKKRNDNARIPGTNLFMNLQRCLAILCVTMILVVLCGCRQSAGEREFQRMIEQTKQQYKASDIKTAVTPLFAKYQQNKRIAVSELPKEITSLPLFAGDPKYIEVSTTRSDSDALTFATGSGFGHWGIIVCRLERDRKVEETMGYRLTAWEDGVYFFRE